MITLPFDEVVVALVGINVLLGWGLYVMVATGQLSIGQAGFMAVGAYAASWLDVELGLPLWLGIALGGLASAVVAVPVAIGAVRTRSVYLIIGTLAVGEIVVTVIGQIDALGGRRGYQVSTIIGPTPVIACCAAVVALIILLERGRWGVAARAIRDDEVAASALGIPIRAARIAAIVLGATITGVAGGLYAHHIGSIRPESFGVDRSFLIALYVLIGGSDHFLGPVVGATMLTYLLEAFQPLQEYGDIVYGLTLILVLIVSPEGLVTRDRVRSIGGLVRRRPPARAPREAGPPRVPPARSLPADREPVLAISNASKRFAGVTALDGVDITLRSGEVLGVIGPNGAGKSTLVHLATGLVTPTAGTVELGGIDVTGSAPEARTRRGMARTFQEVRLFERLTVNETLWLAARFAGDLARPAVPRVTGLAPYGDRHPSELPFAILRKVQLAQALASAPVVLFLDEPATGLDEGQLLELRQIIASISAGGTSVVVIDHHLDVVMDVADRVVVLDGGRKVAEGPSAAIRADPGVRAVFWGRPASVEGRP